LVFDSSCGLQCVNGFAGHEWFEGFHVPGKVGEDSFPKFQHLVLKIGADSLGRVLQFEGLEETGFDSVPSGFVDLEGFQAVPPRLGWTSENAVQFLYFVLTIPGGDGSWVFNS
jgi:hypothetical protein